MCSFQINKDKYNIIYNQTLYTQTHIEHHNIRTLTRTRTPHEPHIHDTYAYKRYKDI